MRRQLRFGAEGDIDMIQECSWCLPAMTFRDVGRNRRCASFDLSNDSETFRRRKGVGKQVTVDHKVHRLSPHRQISKALHVERAHAEPPGKKVQQRWAPKYAVSDSWLRRPTTYSLLREPRAIPLPGGVVKCVRVCTPDSSGTCLLRCLIAGRCFEPCPLIPDP
jgi:hypothetical protein